MRSNLVLISIQLLASCYPDMFSFLSIFSSSESIKSDMNSKLISSMSFLYHSACLCGFMWHITEISTIYFKYDTISSVVFIMPGKEDAKAINICFRVDEFYKNETMFRLFYKHAHPFFYEPDFNNYVHLKQSVLYDFTISHMFDVTYDFNEIFYTYSNQRESHNAYYVVKFIYSHYVCYHIFANLKENNTMPYVGETAYDGGDINTRTLSIQHEPYFHVDILNAARSNLTKVRDGYVILTPRNILPWIEFYTTPRIETGFNEKYYSRMLSGQTYSNERLSSPYADDCISYATLGFVDRNDAINECINDELVYYHKQVYDKKVFRYGVDLKSHSYESSYYTNRTKCTERYPRIDCHRENVLTQIYRFKVHVSEEEYNRAIPEWHTDFMVRVGDAPSFETRSLEKMNSILYICYLFSAIGIWFGISFLDFNPSFLIGIIAQKMGHAQTSSEEATAQVDLGPETTAHAREIASVRRMLLRMEKKIETLERKHTTHVQEINAVLMLDLTPSGM